MGDEPEGVLDGPSPEFKVDKSQQVAKGTVGDGVIDADEAKQAAEESLAAMEKHKKKMADEKEEAKKRELVRAATKGGLGGLASAMAKPKKEEAADKAADRVEGSTNIHVAVRVRPFNGREKESGAKRVIYFETGEDDDVEAHEATTIIKNPRAGDPEAVKKEAKEGAEKKKKDPKKKGDSVGLIAESKFHFDHSYDSHTPGGDVFHSQIDVFNDLGTAMLESTWAGYNCSMFAYGQTGSGKTYSTMGTDEDPGLIPRFCGALFMQMQQARANRGLACRLTACYLEIYNEQVHDLLSKSMAEGQTLKVREHPKLGPYVEGLTKAAVESFQQVANLLSVGNSSRHVAATKMNAQSSRSHAIFLLELVQADPKKPDQKGKKSIVNMVDLAGSERSGAAGTTGSTQKEGSNINKSLTTLGRCINALAAKEATKKGQNAKAAVVPYRDSVLTWLLRESLGGNAVTVMLAALSPADINYDETLNTLRYAESAKKVVLTAKVNKDNTADLLSQLQEEMEALAAKGGGQAGAMMQAQQAAIAELGTDWETRLEATKEIEVQREAILEDHGISLSEMQAALGVKEEVPTLINLNEDMVGDENLVYFLQKGTTIIGSDKPGKDEDDLHFIMLGGVDEFRHKPVLIGKHAFFENRDGDVFISPAMKDGRVASKVLINGKKLTQEHQLLHRERVILEDDFAFRFSCPRQAAAQREAAKEKEANKLKKKDEKRDRRLNDSKEAAYEHYIAEEAARRLKEHEKQVARAKATNQPPPPTPVTDKKVLRKEMLSQWDSLPDQARNDIEKKAMARAATKKNLLAGGGGAGKDIDPELLANTKANAASPAKPKGPPPMLGSGAGARPKASPAKPKVKVAGAPGTSGAAPAAAAAAVAAAEPEEDTESIASIDDSVSSASSDEDEKEKGKAAGSVANLLGGGKVFTAEAAKAESLANKMSIAQKLQRSAVKDQYNKKEEQYKLRIEKLSKDVRQYRHHEAQAMDGLLTAAMPTTGAMAAVADAASLGLLLGSTSLLCASAFGLVAAPGAAVPTGWADEATLPMHSIAGLAALMLLLQTCIRLHHHATLRCTPTHHGGGGHKHAHAAKASWARFMPITFVIAAELFLGAYGWGLAADAAGALTTARQGCAAGFLVLGGLRLTNSILPTPKHHKKKDDKGGKGGKEGTDKQPLLPEKPLNAAEINC